MEKTATPIAICAVGGGISAYKAVDLASRMGRAGYEVHVLMTPAAVKFVAPLSFQAVTRRPVTTEMFPPPQAREPDEIYPHIYPASTAAVFVIAPATADLIARLAHGWADDVVSASALALPPGCRKYFCPAMNSAMWDNAATQRNVSALEKAGWIRIGPKEGVLACGAVGNGRMAEPEEIERAVLAEGPAEKRPLAGLTVLLLSGPTREYLDPVRYISNASSGRMGRALAEEALRRGANVQLVTGPVAAEMLPEHGRLHITRVVSARDMLAAARKLYPAADWILYAAAVADFRPAQVRKGKQPKSRNDWALAVAPTEDIAATLNSGKKKTQLSAGFALQTDRAEKAARRKLAEKNLDLIVINAPAAIDAESAAYQALSAATPGKIESWGVLDKHSCARRIFDRLAGLAGLDGRG